MDRQYSLHDAQVAVANWAEGKPIIQKVFFFGSRTKNTHQPESDLDIAIVLVFDDPDTALAYWMAVDSAWENELSKVLPWEVDLELYHQHTTHVINQGLTESSINVFDRNAA